MNFQKKYIINQHFLPKGTKRRSGLLITPNVKFIVAHDTGNPDSTANGNVGYYERSANEMSASAHLFVDDIEILECIPALTVDKPEKAWHVLYNVQTDNNLYGYNANDAAIGVEYCYGDKINADEAYRKYVWVLAYICYKFDLDPKTSIVGHFFLDSQRKTDPVTGLAHSRRTYDQLLHDVVEEYNICSGIQAVQQYTVVPASGTVRTTTSLNIRKGRPNRKADIVQAVPAGTTLTIIGSVSDGEKINGNAQWYIDTNGNYFWSGGVK